MYVVDTPDHYNGVIIIGQNFQGVTSESHRGEQDGGVSSRKSRRVRQKKLF